MSNRVPPDLEIFRAAHQLIKQHGKDAGFEAAARADSMLDKGDGDGQRVWKRVLKTIGELQRKEPGRGEAVH